METLSFELELVTPMFMGGADPTGPAEFRAASLKGLLRFWFRALYPDKLEDEGRLFGTTEHRAPVTVRVQLAGNQEKYRLPKGSERLHEYAYLGYGLLKYNSQAKKNLTERPCLTAGARATLRLSLANYLTLEDKIKILRSFWALAMLGGLGARSRRGFGSFRIMASQGLAPELRKAVPAWQFHHREEYKKALAVFCKQLPCSASLPEHTCFSAASRLLLGPELSSGLSVLKGLNDVFQQQRSYYDDFRTRKAKTTGYPKDDHDLMVRFLAGRGTPTTAPARAAFGLPHNYFFQSSRTQGFVDLLEDGAKGRRASPLLFHVQGLSTGKAMGVVIFLPARLIPPGKTLHLSGAGGTAEVKAPGFQAVNDFLSFLQKKGAEKIL